MAGADDVFDDAALGGLGEFGVGADAADESHAGEVGGGGGAEGAGEGGGGAHCAGGAEEEGHGVCGGGWLRRFAGGRTRSEVFGR